MSKCSTYGNSSAKGGDANGSGGSKSGIGKYSGGGDSSKGYTQVGRFKAFLYPSDIATPRYENPSFADRYAAPKRTARQGPYRNSRLDMLYGQPKSRRPRALMPFKAFPLNTFQELDAFYRSQEPLQSEPDALQPQRSFTDELEEKENQRKKYQTH